MPRLENAERGQVFVTAGFGFGFGFGVFSEMKI